jgi:hypothetical protein
MYCHFQKEVLSVQFWEAQTVTRRATGSAIEGVSVQVPVRRRILSSTSSALILVPTQPPIQSVPGTNFRGKSGRGVKLTTHLILYVHSPVRLYGLVRN